MSIIQAHPNAVKPATPRHTPPAERETFTSDRSLEYVSRGELETQIGFHAWLWPVALTKELVDNSLDICEAKGISPVVEVIEGDGYFAVRDNGPGVPPETVAAMADFTVTVSSNSRYVSLSRGRLGNASKCILGAPAAAFPGEGLGVTIEACGVRHRITLSVDPIRQELIVGREKSYSGRTEGTLVVVDWRRDAHWARDYEGPRDSLLRGFALLNPHARIIKGPAWWLPGEGEELAPAVPVKKWDAHLPTSVHWYRLDQFTSLINAFLHKEVTVGGMEPTSVRDFMRKFDGFRRSDARAKAWNDLRGFEGKSMLADLMTEKGVSQRDAAELLRAMMEATKPVNPNLLGSVGKANAARGLADLYLADPGTIVYKRELGTAGGRPFVIEVAFGECPGGPSEGVRWKREMVYGVNWTPSIIDPFADWVPGGLEAAEVDERDPVVMMVHVVFPGAGFGDRAKARVHLPREIVQGGRRLIAHVCKRWTARKKAEQRGRVRARRARRKEGEPTRREAAFLVMDQAYQNLISGVEPGATIDARQMFYEVRRLMQEHTLEQWASSQTFTQDVLRDYQKQNPEKTKDWNIVYNDRGHMDEPHGGDVVLLGTVSVREYLKTLDERPPEHRYSHVLLIEKEGFKGLIDQHRIGDRFDVSIAYSKGLSTGALRMLIDGLSARGITTLMLHDYDKTGIVIAWTVRHDSDVYEFTNEPLLVDIGLSLKDVRRLNLEGEVVSYKDCKTDPGLILLERGGTQEDRDFLVREKVDETTYRGLRVELNELRPRQFIEELERKLIENGVRKVVPPDDVLNAAYVQAVRDEHVRRRIEEIRPVAEAEAASLAVPTPPNLAELVRGRIEGTADSWRDAVTKLGSNDAA